jgi:hypothetical protein
MCVSTKRRLKHISLIVAVSSVRATNKYCVGEIALLVMKLLERVFGHLSYESGAG